MRDELTKQEQAELLARLQCREDFTIEVIGGPTGRNPSGRWVIRVTLGKRSVILRKPQKGHIRLDVGQRGAGARPSTRTSDPNEAIRYAEEWLADEQLERLLVGNVSVAAELAPDSITVGQVCALLDRTPLKNVASYPRYKRAAKVACILFGNNLALRNATSSSFTEAIRKRTEGFGGLPPVSLVTAVYQLKDFVTIARHVAELPDESRSGEALRVRHPSLLLSVKWPPCSKRRREPATIEMFTILMSPVEYVDEHGCKAQLPAPVDRADPTGQLRLALAIWFYTGRRFESVLRLKVEDYITDPAIMREVLWEAGEKNGICKSTWAQHFRVLLNFQPQHDKEKNWFPTPIHEALATEFEHYLRKTGLTSGWLFPSSDTKARGRPITQSCLSRPPAYRKKKGGGRGRLNIGRYDRAVLMACRDLHQAGVDPREIFPVTLRKDFDLERDGELLRYAIRKGYKIHRLRSGYATNMERLGYGRARGDDGHEGTNMDAHVNFIASWVPHDGSVKGSRYVHMDPKALQAVANFIPRRLAFREPEDTTVDQISMAVAASSRVAVPSALESRPNRST